ncbi:MAG: ATP-binding protein [Sulfurimonas sp.]|uniref:AAA family ATPase n=1 Tax=Sulfurimonas sp. TaxID=2022749 RepID=UPI0026065FBF|nr:ATP-binding protein [Sulfurimonas sp.]MDD5372807.1 ATP-binding protein [Sulfurimonas sp.]
MILKFGAKNFYSFKEGFEVDLTLNDKKASREVANVLAIKGANASGKTNVLKLLSFISSFAKNSFTEIKPDEPILIKSYFSNNEPIDMFIELRDNGVEYKYELSLTNKKVINETFYKKEKRWTKIIWRDDNKVNSIAQYDELKKIKLRENASLLSTASQYEIASVKHLYTLFTQIIINVHAHGRHEIPIDYQSASKFYYENKDVFKFIKEILKKSDTGIEDIEILDKEDKETGEKEYFPIFYFSKSKKEKFLTFQEQSSGTKELYRQLGLYKIALSNGKTLVLDEFDINLHPDLLPLLVDLFEDKKTNPYNAQMIFTTHHTEIMNKLGKYKIVLVNKEDNESFLYRLDEIPGDMIRNDRPITPIYNAGKIGGKPKILL